MNLNNIPGRGNSTARHTELEALNDILRQLKTWYTKTAAGVLPPASGVSTEAKQDTLITEILNQGITLDNIETYNLRNSWTTIPGNFITMAYYGGVVAGNPSGSLTNVQTAVYSDGGGAVFTQTFTYDINDNILTIVVS